MTSTHRPSVSVITPAFNCASFLANTIGTVRSQTFSDFEHIIVDDGSRDHTLEIARAASSEDQRLRILTHPDGGNHGVSASRNLGLAEARGDLVAFLDGDDEWLPRFLEKQTSVLDESSSAVLAFARARCIDGDGNPLQHPDWPHLEWIIGHAPSPGPLANPFGDFISKTVGIPIVTVLARRKDVAEAGGFVETFHYQVEDAALLAQLCRVGSVMFSDTIVARYRVHSDSFSASLTGLTDADSVWELYCELAKEGRNVEPELADAMLRCIDRYATARGTGWKLRWQRAQGVGEHLIANQWCTPFEVRRRLALALPRALKEKIVIDTCGMWR